MPKPSTRILGAFAVAVVAVAGVAAAVSVRSRAVGESSPDSTATAAASTRAPAPATTAFPTTPTATAPAASATPRTTAPLAVTAADVAAADAAVDRAQAVAAAQGETSVVAVYDRTTGRTFSGGNLTQQFQSASVVKTFIVANLFWTGQMSNPAIAARAYEMITQSDDDDADYLYGLVGYDDLASIVAQRLGLTGLAPPPVSGSWGSTYITAQAMIEFYRYVATDPAIGPWLMNAMAHTTEVAADGTDQYFGLPSATTGWAVKQGWVCCEESVAGVNSTGYIDNDRYIVIILTQGTPAQYLPTTITTITAMATSLLPNGKFPL